MNRARLRNIAARTASLVVAIAAAAPGCSQGEGESRIVGVLDVPSCWKGAFELEPDFLAAIPFREATLIRLQSGSDFQTFSDGLTIHVTDRTKIRPDPRRGFKGRYGEPLPVGLPPGVAPPGTPVSGAADPPLVNMTAYLQRTCRTQNVTLQVVEEVSLPSDDACSAAPLAGADPTQGCAADQRGSVGAGTGKSVIAFTSLFNGKVDEETAAERLTAGCFDVYLADPRDVAPGQPGPPPCRGRLRGSFSFYFERGRPTQPFP